MLWSVFDNPFPLSVLRNPPAVPRYPFKAKHAPLCGTHSWRKAIFKHALEPHPVRCLTGWGSMTINVRGYQLFFCLGGFYLIFRAYSNPNSFFRPAGGAATASLRYPYIWLMAADST